MSYTPTQRSKPSGMGISFFGYDNIYDADADFYSESDTHIIHFDLPRKTEQYIKRLTNHQQNADGEVLLMIDGYNYNELKHIEKTLGESLSQITVPGLEPLNPFVNLSRSKPSHKNKGRSNQNNQGQRKPNNRNNQQKNGRANTNNRQKNNPRNAKAKKPRQKNNNSNNNQNSNGENQTDAQRRQRKGPFGRLNGGAQRKKSGGRDNNNQQGQNQGRSRNNNHRNVKIGVSTRGTAPPPGSNSDRDWKATPQERKVERSKPVVIRYSKKRILEDKPEDS